MTCEKVQGVQLLIFVRLYCTKNTFKPPAIETLSNALFNCGHENIFNNYGYINNK